MKIVKSGYVKEVKNKRLLNDLWKEGLKVKIYKNLSRATDTGNPNFVITDLDDNVYGILDKKSLRNEDIEEVCTDIRMIVRGPLPEINRA